MLIHVSRQHIKESAVTEVIHNLPIQVPHHVHRDNRIKQIAQGMSSKGEGPSVPYAIQDEAGSGKSCLALAYAYEVLNAKGKDGRGRKKNSISLIWWCSAHDDKALQLSFLQLADALQLSPGAGDTARVAAVCDYLKKNNDWLLIFNDAEDPESLKNYIPEGNGDVLVTSRNLGVWPRGCMSGSFNLEEALTFITACLPLMAANADFNIKAENLAIILQGSPFALSQACAYIQALEVDIDEYVHLFSAKLEGLSANEDMSMLEKINQCSFELNTEKLRDINIAKLLLALQRIPQQAMPYDLLSVSIEIEGIQMVAADLLAAYNLEVKEHPAAPALLQKFILPLELLAEHFKRVKSKKGVSAEAREVKKWQARISICLGDLYKDVNLERASAFYKDAVEIADSAIEHVADQDQESYHDVCRVVAMVALKQAEVYLLQAQYASARVKCMIARETYTTAIGKECIEVAECYRFTGKLFQAQFRSKAAVDCHRKAAEIYGKLEGESLGLAECHYNIAYNYFIQGKYARALDRCQQALAIQEEKKDKHGYNRTLLLKGNILRAQGEYSQAHECIANALKFYKDTFGEEHLAPAECFVALGVLYRTEGDYQEAYNNHRKAYEIRKNKLEDNAPLVLQSHVYLAEAIRLAKISFPQPKYLIDPEYLRGIEYHVQNIAPSLTIGTQEEVLGKEHPSVAQSYMCRATICLEKAEFYQAKTAIEQALEILQKTVSIQLTGKEGHSKTLMEHPDVAASLALKAKILYFMGDTVNAKGACEAALAMQKKFLKKFDHRLIECEMLLGDILLQLRDYEAAGSQFNELLKMLSDKFGGADHYLKEEVKTKLAAIKFAQGEHAMASADVALPRRKQASLVEAGRLGKNHPSIATSLLLQGNILCQEECYQDAIEQIKAALAIRMKNFPKRHILAKECEAALAEVYMAGGLHKRALEIYEKMLEGLYVNRSSHPLVLLSKMRRHELRIIVYGNDDESARRYEECFNYEKSIAKEKTPYVAESYAVLARIHLRMGKYAEAHKACQQAMSLTTFCRHSHISASKVLRADIFVAQCQYTLALPLYNQALEQYKRIYSERHSLIADVLAKLAALRLAEGEYDEAQRRCLQALDMQNKLITWTDPRVAATKLLMGKILIAQGEYKQAREHILAARKAYISIYGREKHPLVAACDTSLGAAYEAEANYTKALEHYKKASDVHGSEGRLGYHPDVSKAMLNLVRIKAFMSGGSSRDTTTCERVLSDLQRNFSSELFAITEAKIIIARLYLLRCSYENVTKFFNAAEKDIQRLLENRQLTKKCALYVAYLDLKADIAFELGQYKTATDVYCLALAMRRQNLPDSHPLIAASLARLAAAQHARGQYSDALDTYQEASEINADLFSAEHANLVLILQDIKLCLSLGLYKELKNKLSRAWQQCKAVVNQERHPFIAFLHACEAEYHFAMGDINKAVESSRNTEKAWPAEYSNTHPYCELYKMLTYVVEAKRLGSYYNSISQCSDLFSHLKWRLGKSNQKHPLVLQGHLILCELNLLDGNYTKAQKNCNDAAEVEKDLVENGCLDKNHLNIVIRMTFQGDLYFIRGKYKESLEIYEDALQKVMAIGDDHPLAAEIRVKLAKVKLARGEYTEALDYCEAALAVQSKLFKRGHPSIAASLLIKGKILRAQAKFSDAETCLKDAFAYCKDSYSEKHSSIAEYHFALAELYRAKGYYKRALEHYKSAGKIWCAGSSSNNDKLEVRSCQAGKRQINLVSSVDYINLHFDDERVFSERKRLLGEGHPDVAVSYAALAKIYLAQAKYQRAFECCEAALTLQKTLIKSGQLNANDPNYAASLVIKSDIQLILGNDDEAFEAASAALEMRVAVYAEEHPLVAEARVKLSAVQFAQGQYDEALANCQMALKSQNTSLPKHVDIVKTLVLEANIHCVMGNYDEAGATIKRASELLTNSAANSHKKEKHVLFADCNAVRGHIFMAKKQYEQAYPCYYEAEKLRKTKFPSDGRHLGLTNDMLNLAVATEYTGGKNRNAMSLCGEVKRERLSHFAGTIETSNHPYQARYHESLGHIYMHKEQYEDAAKQYRAAQAIWKVKLRQGHPHLEIIQDNLQAAHDKKSGSVMVMVARKRLAKREGASALKEVAARKKEKRLVV